MITRERVAWDQGVFDFLAKITSIGTDLLDVDLLSGGSNYQYIPLDRGSRGFEALLKTFDNKKAFLLLVWLRELALLFSSASKGFLIYGIVKINKNDLLALDFNHLKPADEDEYKWDKNEFSHLMSLEVDVTDFTREDFQILFEKIKNRRWHSIKITGSNALSENELIDWIAGFHEVFIIDVESSPSLKRQAQAFGYRNASEHYKKTLFGDLEYDRLSHVTSQELAYTSLQDNSPVYYLRPYTNKIVTTLYKNPLKQNLLNFFSFNQSNREAANKEFQAEVFKQIYFVACVHACMTGMGVLFLRPFLERLAEEKALPKHLIFNTEFSVDEVACLRNFVNAQQHRIAFEQLTLYVNYDLIQTTEFNQFLIALKKISIQKLSLVFPLREFSYGGREKLIEEMLHRQTETLPYVVSVEIRLPGWEVREYTVFNQCAMDHLHASEMDLEGLEKMYTVDDSGPEYKVHMDFSGAQNNQDKHKIMYDALTALNIQNPSYIAYYQRVLEIGKLRIEGQHTILDDDQAIKDKAFFLRDMYTAFYFLEKGFWPDELFSKRAIISSLTKNYTSSVFRVEGKPWTLLKSDFGQRSIQIAMGLLVVGTLLIISATLLWLVTSGTLSIEIPTILDFAHQLINYGCNPSLLFGAGSAVLSMSASLVLFGIHKPRKDFTMINAVVDFIRDKAKVKSPGF